MMSVGEKSFPSDFGSVWLPNSIKESYSGESFKFTPAGIWSDALLGPNVWF
jgi:hypothetical protein